MAHVEILNGIERRRRWSDAEKRRIVGETLAPDAVIADVARRNGVAASLVFAWRRQACLADVHRRNTPDYEGKRFPQLLACGGTHTADMARCTR